MEINVGNKKVSVQKPAWLLGVVCGLALVVFSFFKAGVTVETATSVGHEFGSIEECLTRDGVTTCAYDKNFLANEGESFMLDCTLRATNCPTAYTIHLLSTAAGTCTGSPPVPATLTGISDMETATWAGLSAYELVSASGSNGYASQAITRDTTGWSGLTTVANGVAGCTETSCAQASTAQKTITAGALWTTGGRFLVTTGTVGGVEKVMQVACLSMDRVLQSSDQLNLTAKLGQQ